MKSDIFIRVGQYFTLGALFLLPWQTRYIFWRPWVGTTESEFGVISLYATMLIGGIAAFCFFAREFILYAQTSALRFLHIAGGVLLAVLLIFAWVHTHPSAVHAWILNMFFAALLGYATYKTASQKARGAYIALMAGLGASLLLGIWQMMVGFSGESTLLGLAVRNAQHLGDAVLTLGDHRILRMYGSFPHPNVFGAVLALTFAGGIALVIEQKKKDASKISLSRFLFFLAVIAVVLLCISRSAALAMLCAALVWYGDTHAKKTLVVIAFLLPVLVWTTQFVAPELLALRGKSVIETQSISERVAQVNDWWRVMQRGGFLGVGIYYYPEALSEIDGGTRAAWAYQPVHNTFMLIIAELGVLWSLFAALMIGRGAWIARKRLRLCVPIFVCLWSLAWFDHMVWTSWVAMAGAAVMLGLIAQKKNLALTLDE